MGVGPEYTLQTNHNATRLRSQFRLQGRSALVGQELQPKARLFKAMVDMVDKMGKKKKLRMPQTGVL